MSYEFRLPDIGEGVAEGEVVQWFVHEGDAIREDDPLVSVLTDKANVEIPSPRGGRIAKIHAQVGEKVKVGGLLVTIAEGPTGSPAAPAAPSAEAPARPSMAPSPGTPELAPPVPPTPSREGRPALASPYLRRVAAERGIDIDRIRGSGPGGRIIEADLAAPPPVREAPPPAPSPAAVSPAKRAPGATPAVPVPAPGDVERVPIRGLRRVISEHMSESIHRAAHYTYVEEVDVTELMRLRDRMAKHVEKSGTRLSYLPFVIKAVIAGLRAHPWMNATMDDEHSELVVHKSYHIGIATATPDGLIVPVIHRAETKSLAGLAQEIQELSERGRLGKLTRPELSGSTFTITSLGALGGILATPILNYPEVAILGVHKIQKRPVFLPDNTIGAGQLMNLSVSLDHRIIDGAVGAQFLSVVRSHLEDPHQLLADLA